MLARSWDLSGTYAGPRLGNWGPLEPMKKPASERYVLAYTNGELNFVILYMGVRNLSNIAFFTFSPVVTKITLGPQGGPMGSQGGPRGPMGPWGPIGPLGGPGRALGDPWAPPEARGGGPWGPMGVPWAPPPHILVSPPGGGPILNFGYPLILHTYVVSVEKYIVSLRGNFMLQT